MRRFIRTLALVGLATVLLAGGVALAAPGPEAANPALINPTAEVQLTVHKYFGAPVDPKLPNDGTVQTVTGREALEGVRFDVYRVGNVDLTTNAGWQAATALSGHQVTTTEIAAGKIVLGGVEYPLTKETTITTDSTGTAVFTKPNGVGLYLVFENLKNPDGSFYSAIKRPSGQGVQTVYLTGATAFLVTLPLTNPANQNNWLYGVHIYPKNEENKITKTVADKGVVFPVSSMGDPLPLGFETYQNNVNAVPSKNNIIYTITTSIPAGMTGPEIARYEIIDSLSTFLTYVSSSVKIVNATAAGGAESLAAGLDYLFTPDPVPAPIYPSVDRELKWAMTPAGLAKLAAAKANNVAAQVQITLNTNISASREILQGLREENLGAMIIPNQARFLPSEAWWKYTGRYLESDKVGTSFFDVMVRKTDLKAPTTDQPDLTGAEFKIYWDPTSGDGQCSAADISGIPIATSTVVNKMPDGSPIPKDSPLYNVTFFTDLQLPSIYNWTFYPDKANWLSYCVVESKAPPGYQLSAGPKYISEYKQFADPAGNSSNRAVVEFQNVKASNLPFTGGTGATVLGVVGALLIGGGIAYYVVSRRRRG